MSTPRKRRIVVIPDDDERPRPRKGLDVEIARGAPLSEFDPLPATWEGPESTAHHYGERIDDGEGEDDLRE